MDMVVHTLPHHNRVVDNNAQHQQKSERRQHIQRHIVGG